MIRNYVFLPIFFYLLFVSMCFAENIEPNIIKLSADLNLVFKTSKFYIADTDFPHIYAVDDRNISHPTLKAGTIIQIKNIVNQKDLSEIVAHDSLYKVGSNHRPSSNTIIYYFKPINVTTCNDLKPDLSDDLCKNKIYYFTSSSYPELYFSEYSSIVHGTLIVPFKYRFRDGNITGDSTLGYYIGTSYRLYDIDIVPLISVGLSIISIAGNEQETDTAYGVSAALGIVFKHIGNFQFGFISGIDHIGGNNTSRFKYQDDIWCSFMVGYNFTE